MNLKTKKSNGGIMKIITLIFGALLALSVFAEDGDMPRSEWTFTTKQYREAHSTGLLKKKLPAFKYQVPSLREEVVIPDQVDLRPFVPVIRDQDGLIS